LPWAQLSPLAHSAALEQALPALPSLQVPELEPSYVLPQIPLRHSLGALQAEPSEPSPHVPSSEPGLVTQMPLSQSAFVAQ
jgi:hypothetical protein